MNLMLKKLSKSYSSHKILDDLSLSFESGVNYLIAPNGSGKSTLLRLITGIEQQDTGEILFNNTSRKFSDYGSYVPDKMTMYPFITGQEFLDLVCHAKKLLTKDPDLLNMLNEFNIYKYLKTPFSKMSLGTQKKFFIIAGLMGNYECLLMDEPSNAIDKHSLEILANYLKNQSTNKLMLIATHDQHLISQLPGKIFKLNSE